MYGHERAAGYLTKYLTGKHPSELLHEVSGPAVTVSRSLTRRTGVTMVTLRKTRRLWAALDGRCPMPDWPPEELATVARVLDGRTCVPGHLDTPMPAAPVAPGMACSEGLAKRVA